MAIGGAIGYRTPMNLAALSFRNFRIYLGGNIFSLNALWMQRVTIGWIAWDLTQSASFVGLIAFLNFAPTMVTGPLFGVLVDRVNVKQAARVTQSLMLAIATGLYLCYDFGLLNEYVLALITGLSGLVSSAHNPVRMSLTPRLVAREAVSSVINIAAINFNLARLTGPALGGWIIAVWGVDTALLVQVFFYVPFLFAIGFLNPRDRQQTRRDEVSFFSALSVGIQHSLANTQIRDALMITGLFAFILRGTLEILPVIADGVFHQGAAGLGILTASAGFGALMAGMAKVLMPGQVAGQLPKPALVATLIGIALVPVLGLSRSWDLSILIITCLGFAGTLSGISMQTAIQMDLDDDLRGRVMSLWVMVGIGAAAAGAVFLGFLTDEIGFSMALGSTGMVGIILLVILLARVWTPSR